MLDDINKSKPSDLPVLALFSMVNFILLHAHLAAVSYATCTFQFAMPHPIAVPALECPLLSENAFTISKVFQNEKISFL